MSVLSLSFLPRSLTTSPDALRPTRTGHSTRASHLCPAPARRAHLGRAAARPGVCEPGRLERSGRRRRGRAGRGRARRGAETARGWTAGVEERDGAAASRREEGGERERAGAERCGTRGGAGRVGRSGALARGGAAGVSEWLCVRVSVCCCCTRVQMGETVPLSMPHRVRRQSAPPPRPLGGCSLSSLSS